MVIQTVALDPNAQAYTDDEIAVKANAAAVPIDNIAADSVGDTELTTSAAKDNLDALADTARGYIQTAPVTGEFPVTAAKFDATGKVVFDYDDVPIV